MMIALPIRNKSLELTSHSIIWSLLFFCFYLISHWLLYKNLGVDLLLVNGGIVLAALLAPKALWHKDKSYCLVFLPIIFVLDLCLKYLLQDYAFFSAFLGSLTLISQAVLSLYFIQRLDFEASLPDSKQQLLSYIFLGALLPSAVSSLIPSVYFIYQTAELNLFNILEHWAWWFIRQSVSLVLISPLILLGRYPLLRLKVKIRHFLAQESIVLFSFVCLFSFFIFIKNSYEEHILASHSFLLVNVLLVWLFSINIREKNQALQETIKMEDTYDKLSRVNQILVKSNVNAHGLAEQVCRIIIEDSKFYQVGITFIHADQQKNILRIKCAQGQHESAINYDHPADQCEIVQQVLTKQSLVCLNQCTKCAQFASCQLKQKSSGGVAGFPIFLHQKLEAVLSIFSEQQNWFDETTLRLLTNMADNVGFALEVEDRKQQLKQTAEVFEHSRELIIVADAKGTILNVNPAFTRITGYLPEEVIGKNPKILQSGRQTKAFYKNMWCSLLTKGYWGGEYWNKRKNGEIYPQRGTISAIFTAEGQIGRLIAVMEDVSERVSAEEKILHLANYDPLTNLPNRVLLEDRFKQAMAAAHRDKKKWALLFIDLDEFKHINDALGHASGDELLRQVSMRLSRQIRDGDTLSRFGGDEFIVLMQGGEHDAAFLAERLIAEIKSPFLLREQAIHIGCSIGIALTPDDGQVLEQLISAADVAMYQAKESGKGNYAFYAAQMQATAQGKITLKTDLEKALHEQQFCLYYQPKMILNADHKYEIVGVEALLRWNHPEKGMIFPGDFIPLAERNGQIVGIDQWVLRAAVMQAKIWQDKGYKAVPIAVNLSASLFAKSHFVTELDEILQEANLPGHLLELEITEYVAMQDIEYTLRTLKALKALGLSLSMDDFGTGYSSLAYLRDFPIDAVKIDMTFVKNVYKDTKNQGIVRAIISLADTLNLKTIAEGVECQEDLDFLKQYHCQQYQGYFFDKPMGKEKIEHLYLKDKPSELLV